MNQGTWPEAARTAPGKLALLGGAIMGLVAVWLAVLPAQARAQSQCNNNGACCDDLNAFWKEKVYHQKLSEALDPHPLSKDFVALDGSTNQWPEKLSCPSVHSRVAGGLKLLHDFSHSGSADRNYYDWAKKILQKTEYAFILLNLEGSFAEANGTMRAIAFSALSTPNETPARVAGTIVHEVFHVERGAAHVICNHGQSAGKNSCDENIALDFSQATGAYSPHILFLHNLIKSGVFPVHVPSAQSFLNLIIRNQINTLPEFGPDGVTPFLRYYGVN
jgi:hypothetical protein